MTSPANSQIPQAPNSSAAAPSYASAAGASKKPASTPLIATGSNPSPPVVVGGSPAQHAKSSGPSPVNGRPAITPAVPAAAQVSHGSSTTPNTTNNTMNGATADHSRKSSVTISANGPNNLSANGGASSGASKGIKFGFESSPAIAHSTPSTMASNPINIPGGNAGAQNQGVPSPAHSPSPIPQPSASGGRPPSGMSQQNTQMTFGSLGSDGDRHMRQGSVPPQNPAALASQPGAHIRRESAVSQHSDMSGAGGNRPNFNHQGGRGRGGPGYNPQHPSFNNANMGFPPTFVHQNHQGGRGRGGPNMTPSFQPARAVTGFPNSPGPGRSPALNHAQPHVQPTHSQPGTPNMHQIHPVQMQTPPQYHYAAPNMPPQHPQVHPPFLSHSSHHSFRQGKKKSSRRGSDRSSGGQRFVETPFKAGFSQPRHLTGRGDALCDNPHLGAPDQRFQGLHPAQAIDSRFLEAKVANLTAHMPAFLVSSLSSHAPIDLHPGTGNFERIEQMLTRQKQFAYPSFPGAYDPRHAGSFVPPYMNQGPAGSPGANFQPGPYAAAPYHSPAPQPMSRTSSHSDRPPSSTGQTNQAPVVVSGSQQNGQQKAGLGSSFRPPKKSAAITIKNAQGEALDFSSMKAPASPSPSIQQSKTPPVSISTPPPAQKPTTSVAHGRNESVSAPKSAKEIQEELRAKIMAAAHSEEKAKEEAPAKAQPAEEKQSEPKPAAEKQEEDKIVKQTETVTKAPELESEPKKEEPPAATKPEEPAGETEDERMEREIREMEEAEAQREKEAAEYEIKKKARLEEEKRQEAAKKATSAADEDRKLREAEAEAERLELEKEKRRAEAEASGSSQSFSDLLAKARSGEAVEPEAAKVSDVADKLANLNIGKEAKSPATEKPRGSKPPALNLAPLNTKSVEPPQPSAALQSLQSARFLTVMKQDMYPTGIQSPNPALNPAIAAKKGKTFKYDAQFLLQFQKVFTEQPSMEFHQQVKSLIGDNDGSRSASTPRPGNSRQPSRSGAFPPSQQNMGSFTTASARGTTSAERFARSNAAMANGMPAAGGMGSFGRTGSFPMGAPMSRSASSANMGAPNSPRTGSRRGPSRRGGESAKEAQAAKTMPLTAGQEVKPITVSATGWKPSSIVNKAASAATPTGNMDPEMVQRKVKANLNKMTPEKFEKIADQILAIAAQSKNESDGRTLRQVIQLTFEKATDEAHWASMYAKFCKRMLDTMSPEIRDETLKDKNGEVVGGGALFRKYLLNRCQEEFERGWKVNLPEKPVEDESAKPSAEAAMLSDEYYIAAAAKRRGLGLVQFIGELYKLGMLTERIMHACVQKLVDYETTPEEAEIESLSKLLRTIGANLDANPKGKGVMDAYFDRIQGIINMPDLPSRLKFMLMDVVDLRRSGWDTKEDNKGPKTLDEVRAEAEAAAAAKAQENARSNQRGGPGGRPTMGRGDARSFSQYNQQQNSNHVGMDDLRRLKGATSRATGGAVTLGPTSMFSSRSNSGRRLGPGGSLGRAGEDSGASSRTGTPPTTHTNAFSALANLDSENPASPPSTAASPALSKAVPDSSAATESK